MCYFVAHACSCYFIYLVALSCKRRRWLQLAAAPLATYAAAKSEFRHPRVHQTAAFCCSLRAPLCIFHKSCTLARAPQPCISLAAARPPPPPPRDRRAPKQPTSQPTGPSREPTGASQIAMQLFNQQPIWRNYTLATAPVFYSITRKRWSVALIGNASFSSVCGRLSQRGIFSNAFLSRVNNLAL